MVNLPLLARVTNFNLCSGVCGGGQGIGRLEKCDPCARSICYLCPRFLPPRRISRSWRGRGQDSHKRAQRSQRGGRSLAPNPQRMGFAVFALFCGHSLSRDQILSAQSSKACASFQTPLSLSLRMTTMRWRSLRSPKETGKGGQVSLDFFSQAELSQEKEVSSQAPPWEE